MIAGARVSLPGRQAGTRARGGSWALYALLAGSGATALVYESLWIRLFTGLFGATAPAGAATVSAMFAGLALGSWWFGRRVPRWSRPLRVYALLEIGAGAAAWAVFPLQRGYESVAPSLYGLLADVPALHLAVKTLQVLVAVLPPTFLLGGTLPVVTHAVDDHLGQGGRSCGRFYAANTSGAVLGALAVPFLLLPYLGASRSYTLAVVGSAVLGGAAWWLDLRWEKPRILAPAMASGVLPRAAPSPDTRALLALAFASGFLMLGLEVIWVRMLSQVHQNSVHAFAIVLAVFLAAIALGAMLGTLLAERARDAWLQLKKVWMVAGLLTLCAPAAFVPLTGGLDYLTGASRGGYFEELLLVCSLSFAPATVCAGSVLTILLSIATRSGGTASPRVGRLLAANTAGSVVGPLATTFVLLPWLGMWGSAVALGLSQLVIPLVLRVARGAPRWSAAVALSLAALLVWRVVLLPRVYLDPERGERLAWIREGSHGIASAVRDPGGLRLKFDNFYTLGGTASPGDARQLGHIPLVLHQAPRQVAFLGLGTGITASAALVHGVDQVVVFELLPEVAEAARTIFADQNRHLLADPRVELIVDDARSHLRTADAEYDVIVGDLVVPWRRGESFLFTREHFVNVRRALTPGGLFCQWLPLYQMSEQEFRIVAATFLDVFPQASVWRSDFVAAFPVLGLVGQEDDRPLAADAIDRRAGALAPALVTDSRYMVHPAGFWLHLVGSLSADEPWVRVARRNTLDLPWLELLSARTPLAGGERDPSVFTGDPLLALLDELEGRVARGSLTALDLAHLRWRDLGGDIFRASCLDGVGDEERARSLAFSALRELPSLIQESVLGSRIDARTK